MQLLNEIITKEYPNISAIIIRKKNQIIFESYYHDRNRDSMFHITSLTKSISSILIGIAIDKGYIQDVNQTVLSFFPDYQKKRGENEIQHITIKDMLTMRAPFKYRTTPYKKHFESTDWVKSSLDLLGGAPAGIFRYTPIVGPDILAGIIKQTTKLSLLDFANRYLFQPLLIEKKQHIFFQNRQEYTMFLKNESTKGWICGPNEINSTGWGLTLSAIELDKIGCMLLDPNQTIVSREWINESMSNHSFSEAFQARYGYYWWTDIEDGFAGIGDSGNLLYVNPRKELVVTILCEHSPRAKSSISLVKEHILHPCME